MTRMLTMSMMTGTTRKIIISVIHDQIEKRDMAERRTSQLSDSESYVHRYNCIAPSIRQPTTIQTDTLTARAAVQ